MLQYHIWVAAGQMEKKNYWPDTCNHRTKEIAEQISNSKLSVAGKMRVVCLYVQSLLCPSSNAQWDIHLNARTPQDINNDKQQPESATLLLVQEEGERKGSA